MNKFMHRKLFLTAVTLSSPFLVSAAESATTPASTSGGLNVTLISLVSLVVVLLFVIGMLANVLTQLTFAYRNKMRKQKENARALVKTLILFAMIALPTAQALAAEGTQTADVLVNQAPQLISGIRAADFYVIMSVIGIEFLVILTLVIYIRILTGLLSDKPVLSKAEKKKGFGEFWDRFHKAVAIEKEKDILLDHNYDGIQELDNSLPPWWKYGFYLTIVVAIVYIYHYHVAGTGQVSHDEYVAEMQQAEEEKAAYLAKSANSIDENSVKLLTDATDITAGQQIFQSTCFACHAKDGGGAVGPNLTDDYWLHGGSVKDIFKSIKYGWQDKGMKSWKDDYSPKQIAQLASYVRSLHGTKAAAPKDKQGELYIESEGQKTADSSKVAVAQ